MRECSIWIHEWQDHKLDKSQWPEIMHPNSMAWSLVADSDDYRIEVEGIEITVSSSRMGVNLVFHGRTVPIALARRVAEEICDNIQRTTGQEGLVSLSHPH